MAENWIKGFGSCRFGVQDARLRGADRLASRDFWHLVGRGIRVP